MDYSPTGDLSDFTAQEIAAACEWNGDPDLWLAALKECGWLDPDGQVHDWHDYAGRLIEERAKDRERKREERRRKSTGHVGPSSGCPPDVQCPSGVPNPTQPNSTDAPSLSAGAREESPGSPPGKPPDSDAESPSWEEFLAYAQRIGYAAEWHVRDKFLAQEAKGWHLVRWRAYCARAKGWWENDGKLSEPPAKRDGKPSRTAEANTVQEVIKAKRL